MFVFLPWHSWGIIASARGVISQVWWLGPCQRYHELSYEIVKAQYTIFLRGYASVNCVINEKNNNRWESKHFANYFSRFSKVSKLGICHMVRYWPFREKVKSKVANLYIFILTRSSTVLNYPELDCEGIRRVTKNFRLTRISQGNKQHSYVIDIQQTKVGILQ